MEKVEGLILRETNVKELEYVLDTSGIIVKKIKPNFKILGPKYGPKMKLVAGEINKFGQAEINMIEHRGSIEINLEGKNVLIEKAEVEILSEDIEGWLVTNKSDLTVALDINLDEDLKNEGIARELVNRIQNLRKEQSFNVTDRISLTIETKTG